MPGIKRNEWVILVVILIASLLLVEPIRPYLRDKYGLDPTTLLVLFISAEVCFDAGLAVMLWFGGVRRLSWSAVKSFSLRKTRIDWRHPGLVAGLAINRGGWIMPFAYVLVVGWRSLPWFVLVLAAAEIAVTLWVGLVVLGLRVTARQR